MRTLCGMLMRANEYERAFEGWLAENGVRYVAVDQGRRSMLVRNRIKTFDFLVYPGGVGESEADGWWGPDRPSVVVVEVKGRLFKGSTLGGRPALQCWATVEDVQGLLAWQRQFDEPGERARAVFVFAYRFELPVVETDGRQVYEFGGHQYMFYAVAVDAYCRSMKVRSSRWGTVMLGAADFRRLAADVRGILTDSEREGLRCLTGTV